MSKSRAVIPVLASIAGAGAIGTLAYAFARLAKRAAQAPVTHAAAVPASSPRPAMRESMVVARSSVPEPLTVVLDLDGVFRGEAALGPAEATVHCDVRLPSPASADDGEPPQADELGGYWLSRATQSERSLRGGDLDIDLDNAADFRHDQDEDDYGYDEELDPGLVAAGGWPRG